MSDYGYYDDSEHSSSPAEDAGCRGILRRAKVFFDGYQSSTPPLAAELIALLSHWPWPHPTMEEEESLASTLLAQDEAQELQAAIQKARQVLTQTIECRYSENTTACNIHINYPILSDSSGDSSKPTREGLVYNFGERWPLGSNSWEDLWHVKPDLACGLAQGASEILAPHVLSSLRDAPDIRLVCSPSILQEMVYPSVIFKARTHLETIVWAENEVAAAASRALGLLAQLTKLSKISHQHCVVAFASAGSRWNVYVAYEDLDEYNKSRVHLVPVLRKSLLIEDFMDRVRLSYIVIRIRRWMQGPYLSKISEQLERLWQDSQQPQLVEKRAKIPRLTEATLANLQTHLAGPVPDGPAPSSGDTDVVQTPYSE